MRGKKITASVPSSSITPWYSREAGLFSSNASKDNRLGPRTDTRTRRRISLFWVRLYRRYIRQTLFLYRRIPDSRRTFLTSTLIREQLSRSVPKPDPARRYERRMTRDPPGGVTTYTKVQREAHFTLQTASQQVMLAHSVANLQVCSRVESDAPPQQRKTLLINFTFANIHERKKRSQTVAWSLERGISPGGMLSQLSTHQITLCRLIL